LKKNPLGLSEFGNFSEAVVIPATSLFASPRRGNSVKLTAVGFSKKPVSRSNAKHRLFCISSEFRALSLRPSSASPFDKESLSEAQTERKSLTLSGLCGFDRGVIICLDKENKDRHYRRPSS
jgi:hypothetical protein